MINFENIFFIYLQRVMGAPLRNFFKLGQPYDILNLRKPILKEIKHHRF